MLAAFASIFVKYDKKFANKTTLKALDTNCTVLP